MFARFCRGPNLQAVVNVGAGAGSYEPDDRTVVAVEPSSVMLSQRMACAAPAVRAVAEALPFRKGAFDLALAVLTVHHWTDVQERLREMRRVARRQVVVTWDPGAFARTFWFARDYLPEALERESKLATLAATLDGLGSGCEVRSLDVPATCQDGFFAASWKRPRAYLDPRVRAAISSMALLPTALVDRAISDLERDLDDGTWTDRYRSLSDFETLDLGYRIVTSR